MTPAMWLTLGLFAASLIFQAGGFCWLAFNHFRSVNKRLLELAENDRRMEHLISNVRRDVAFLKGRASAGGKR